MKRIRKLVRYRGHVQGVGFRMTTLSEARNLDVHGFVRNEPDGSVLLDVEGPAEAVKELLQRVDQSMRGNIQDCQVETREPQNRDGFHIA